MRAGDLDAMAAMWADARVTAHVGGTPRSRTDVWLRMLATPGHWAWRGYGYWAVDRGGALVGNAGFADFERPLTPALTAPELGYALAAEHWGQGLATELLAALTQYADARGWPLTQAVIDPGNTASIRAAVRVGYVHTHDAAWTAEAATGVYARRRSA